MKSFDLRRNLKIAISVVYYVFWEVCRLSLRLVGRSSRQRLTILYYHGVAPSCRSNFARQIEALHRGALVVPASYRGKLPDNRKCVAITFDDAFVSVAENALPELYKHSFHCTIFVPVGWLGRTPGWKIETAGLAQAPELSEVVMSAEQLQALSRSLVSLASHTMTHPSLPDLQPEQAREELERSRVGLAELIGRDVSELSFPYGAHDESTIMLCRAALYETVYSITPEEIDTTGQEVLRGRTKTDPSDGPLEFFLKINGAYEWMRYQAALKQALRSTFSGRPLRSRIGRGLIDDELGY
jgi:peptidoglycan/xylan/chitin deacetylase (PgdA/CDA1 family)